eukprot:CAMPEP_0181375484 /NCGR_PEP_ID=MMETSP1106-20121128/16688_1 /TAXON_ID=81844 /ORGANISM="Mantoniella antarctica, Strain SL-175" /LENGTH=39 /DNA_ID= /DNA_START= /DNA_END= /DNA_ORIENTATION=
MASMILALAWPLTWAPSTAVAVAWGVGVGVGVGIGAASF